MAAATLLWEQVELDLDSDLVAEEKSESDAAEEESRLGWESVAVDDAVAAALGLDWYWESELAVAELAKESELQLD